MFQSTPRLQHWTVLSKHIFKKFWNFSSLKHDTKQHYNQEFSPAHSPRQSLIGLIILVNVKLNFIAGHSGGRGLTAPAKGNFLQQKKKKTAEEGKKNVSADYFFINDLRERRVALTKTPTLRPPITLSRASSADINSEKPRRKKILCVSAPARSADLNIKARANQGCPANAARANQSVIPRGVSRRPSWPRGAAACACVYMRNHGMRRCFYRLRAKRKGSLRPWRLSGAC